MRHLTKAGWLAALASLAVGPSLAAPREFTAGTLLIEHPWSRATPNGAAVGGGYVTIINKGALPDRLVGGSFEASSGFELHEMSMTDGVMRMRPTGPLEIPAGGTLSLTPSGKHVMLKGLKAALKKGEDIAGTLVFDRAGTVPVRFDIQGIGAKGPGDDAAAGPAGQVMPGMDMH